MTRAIAQADQAPRVTDLLIRQKCEAMIEYGYVALRQFPKAERHVLAAEMRGCMWALLRLIVTCHKRYHKKTTLQELDTELDLLRSQVRMARNLGYLDFKKYETWAKLNDEIGRMVGGWVKSISQPMGRHIETCPDPWRQLEQRGDRGGVRAQLEQRALELQRQHRGSSRFWGMAESAGPRGRRAVHPSKGCAFHGQAGPPSPRQPA